MVMRKGFFFSMDAMLGSILIVAGLLLMSQVLIQEESTLTITFLSQDLMSVISELRVNEMTHPVIVQMVNAGDIQNTNSTLLEQLGEFWALNDTVNAVNFTDAMFEELLPDRFGLSLDIEGELFFNKSNPENRTHVVSSRRMITGVKKGEAMRGSTAAAYLKKIEDKRTASFLYYGGFAGQGNITGYMRDIPADVNGSDVKSMILEVDAESSFNLYINSDFCGSFTPITGNMTPDQWNITSCAQYIISGANAFLINFNGSVNSAYIAGGYIKVNYLTDVPVAEILTGADTYWFPGISGVINIYDSFYAPGQIESMSAYVHYFANHTQVNNTFYLTIGNTTVYQDQNSTAEMFVFLSDDALSTQLNYSLLDLSTVPIRVGYENLSFITEYSGNADVMLITDVSGSMEWRMDADWSAGTRRNCDSSSLNLSTTTRLSVAKCLDKQFAADIINISGNKAGLVSYETSTHGSETRYPTTNLTILNETIGIATPESGYHADGNTCICCGINTAYDVLTGAISSTSYISSGQSWLYTTNGFTGPPVPDNGTIEWYEHSFNDSAWSSGNAVMGSNENSIGPNIVTDMGNSMAASSTIPDLWDMAADSGSIQVDFTSGLNQTGNTFGESGGADNDGWDSSFGYFGTNGYDVYMNTDPNEDGDQSDNNVNSNEELRIYIGDSWDGDDAGVDEIPDSGAFGVELYISPEMYAKMSSPNGRATLYFDWQIDPSFNLAPGEEGWIKAQFGQSGSMNYLGTNMDENGSQSDATPEVFWCEDTGWSANPDHECPNIGGDTFVWNLTSYITGSGWYYLVIGAKATEELGDIGWDEDWEFEFDNIYIEIFNQSDKYYLRKHFTVSDMAQARKGIINLLSDDKAKVYLNGNLIYEEVSTQVPEYWNTGGLVFGQTNFRSGDNVVAVELENAASAAKFDLELLGLNSSRDLAMMVMTDGQANEDCPTRQATFNAVDDAIQAACDAKEDYGITVYAVGFSDAADEDTLQGIAACGGSVYKKSDNVEELSEFYRDVAQSIITASRQSQTVLLTGSLSDSDLYPDSYIQINYTPGVSRPGANEISVVFQTDQFNSCNPTIDILPGLRLLDTKVTSYSSEHWTDLVKVNGQVAYNLSAHDLKYIRLGDPYIVNIPPGMLQPGTNTIEMKTGDEPYNNTGCSDNNTMVYEAAINLSTSRSEVLESAIGCKWQVEFESGKIQNFSVPSSYTGLNVCSYTNASISYNTVDAYDVATYSILSGLDFDNDGRVFVDFMEEDLEVVVTLISQVPYLWGPAIAEVNAWE
ncbi:VWA domain-containing protein [Nanoarchaeota archaeon]